MALADPQPIIVAAVTTNAPRTSTGNNASTYTTADGNMKLTVSHAYGKRTRRLVRLQVDKTIPNPLNSSVNIVVSGSARLVLDVPPGGFTNTEASDIADALADWIIVNKVAFAGGQN